MMTSCKRTVNGFLVNVYNSDDFGGKIIARLVMPEYLDALFPHTEYITKWTPRTLKFFKKAIEYVKEGAKGKYKHFLTQAYYDADLPKKEKYWRIMGFDKFTDSEYEGRKVRIAWMEII